MEHSALIPMSDPMDGGYQGQENSWYQEASEPTAVRSVELSEWQGTDPYSSTDQHSAAHRGTFRAGTCVEHATFTQNCLEDPRFTPLLEETSRAALLERKPEAFAAAKKNGRTSLVDGHAFLQPGSVCSDYKSCKDLFMRPYLKPKKKTLVQSSRIARFLYVDILRSAPVRAWRSILVLYTVMVLISLLPVLGAVHITNELSSEPFSAIFSVFTFLVSVAYGIYSTNFRGLLRNIFVDMSGNVVNYGHIFGATLDTTKFGRLVRGFKYTVDPNCRDRVTAVPCMLTVMSILMDVSEILRSMLYSTKWLFRTGVQHDPRQLPTSDGVLREMCFRLAHIYVDCPFPLDWYTFTSEKRREAPMNTNSRRILAGMNGSVLEALRSMLFDRVSWLIQAQVFPPQCHASFTAMSNSFGGSFGLISFFANQGRVERILTGLFNLTIWAYCIWIVFFLYPIWFVAHSTLLYYLMMLVPAVFLQSLLFVFTNTDNPFNKSSGRQEEFNFGDASNAAARASDVMMEPYITMAFSYTAARSTHILEQENKKEKAV